MQMNNFPGFFGEMVSFCVTLYATKPCSFLQPRRSFLSVSYSKTDKTINIPEEMRYKQRIIRTYNNAIALLD